MGVAKGYLAVLESKTGGAGHKVTDLTEIMARVLAGDSGARKKWEAARAPSGYQLSMIIPKETPGADPVALWCR